MKMPQDPRYHGFDLRSVCWGYREIFGQAIEGLFAQGLLGEDREAVTREFFDLLKGADQSCYDHVLKEFLCALNPRTRWLLSLPSIFTDLTETGKMLAECKLYYGIGFFRLLGEGKFGSTPAQVRHLLTLTRRLFEVDGDLAFAFLGGFHKLLERLQPLEIERYVQEGLTIHARSPGAARRFMSVEGRASESIILLLTQECRLKDVAPSLTNLVHALAGVRMEIDDLGRLDSDDLLERGSNMICLYRWLYLPMRVRHFATTTRNCDWYRLCAVVAASMLLAKCFPVLHGHPDYNSCADLVGDDPARINLFTIIEYTRALRAARARWPGSRRLIAFGFATEFSRRPPACAAEELLVRVMDEPLVAPDAKIIARAADELANAFAVAAALDKEPLRGLLAPEHGLGQGLLRACAFLPDFLFPGRVSTPPSDAVIADMKEKAAPRRRDDDQEKAGESARPAGDEDEQGDEQEDNSESGPPACYWYPEWNQSENDYLDNWCGVFERIAEVNGPVSVPESVMEQAARARKVFERLKPELVHMEKRLDAGDAIDMERLVGFMVNRKEDPNPRVDFYQKPLINQRDLAVLILLDLSGSTGESAGTDKVIDVERNAALILGQGLAALGDRFSIAGFSSNGREACEYITFKDFDDAYGQEVINRLGWARPRNSTRMGAALRHAGWIFSQIDSRQRLILLITDGKPMDSGYDPQSRYAQHDVRMACEENLRQSIATFAISTEANTLSDMEIMFPRRRFAILPDIRNLPDILPRLYVHMTVR